MRFLLLIAACCSPSLPPRRSRPARPRSPRIAGSRRCREGRCGRDRAAIAAGEKADAVDGHRRTPLHVAAHLGHQAAAQALIRGGANPNALDAQQYDIVTIVAVTNDVPMLKLALAAAAIRRTSPAPIRARR